MPALDKDASVEFTTPEFLSDFKTLIDRNTPQPVTPTQLQRELSLQASIFHKEFSAIRDRFESYDKAIVLLQDYVNRMPTPAMVDSDVKHLASLTSEQIVNLRLLFDKTGDLNNTALQAAFAAAKEAVGAAQVASALANTKMETNFTKQIDGIGTLLGTLEKALTSKVDDQEKTLTSKFDDVKTQISQAVPRNELLSTMNAVTDRVSGLEKSVANYQGALVVVGLLCTAIPTLIAILLNFLRH